MEIAMAKSENNKFDQARRRLFKAGIMAAAGAAVARVTVAMQPARAAKASKAVAMYQPNPHGDQSCAKCIHFIPGATAEADGTCQVVDGSISPNGWCVLYAPKS
jgi:High potential iron-sulfur protein